MMKSATALGRNGLQDWLIQRVSAVIIAGYVLFLVGFLLCNPLQDHRSWLDLFSGGWMKFATFLTLIALLAHAWIGIWTVMTDYLKTTWLRLVLQVFIAIILLLYLVWGMQIIWR